MQRLNQTIHLHKKCKYIYVYMMWRMERDGIIQTANEKRFQLFSIWLFRIDYHSERSHPFPPVRLDAQSLPHFPVLHCWLICRRWQQRKCKCPKRGRRNAHKRDFPLALTATIQPQGIYLERDINILFLNISKFRNGRHVFFTSEC